MNIYIYNIPYSNLSILLYYSTIIISTCPQGEREREREREKEKQ